MTTFLARASLASIRRAHAMPEVHWVLSAAVVAAGWAGSHALFALLLAAWVASRFLQNSRGAATPDGVAPARHLSREVYLILYTVLLLRLMSEAVSFSWHEGALWGFSPHFLAVPGRAFIEAGERFRPDLLGGVVALCLIRVLAAYEARAAAVRASAVQPAFVLLGGHVAQKE